MQAVTVGVGRADELAGGADRHGCRGAEPAFLVVLVVARLRRRVAPLVVRRAVRGGRCLEGSALGGRRRLGGGEDDPVDALARWEIPDAQRAVVRRGVKAARVRRKGHVGEGRRGAHGREAAHDAAALDVEHAHCPVVARARHQAGVPHQLHEPHGRAQLLHGIAAVHARAEAPQAEPLRREGPEAQRAVQRARQHCAVQRVHRHARHTPRVLCGRGLGKRELRLVSRRLDRHRRPAPAAAALVLLILLVLLFVVVGVIEVAASAAALGPRVPDTALAMHQGAAGVAQRAARALRVELHLFNGLPHIAGLDLAVVELGLEGTGRVRAAAGARLEIVPVHDAAVRAHEREGAAHRDTHRGCKVVGVLGLPHF